MHCSIKVVCTYVTVCQKGGMSTTQTTEIFLSYKSTVLHYFIGFAIVTVLFYFIFLNQVILRK